MSFEQIVERIVEQDPRFQPDAYDFLRAALDFTQQRMNPKEREVQRHVSGQQLLHGIRQYALREFGPMTVAVFNSWGIQRCEDFGDIVFHLVDHGFLKRQETDRRDDFSNGYSFEDAFVKPFLPASRLGPQRSRLEPSPEGA